MQASSDPVGLYASLPAFRRKIVDDWEQKERAIRDAVMTTSVKDRPEFERKSRAFKTYLIRELNGAAETLFTVWGEGAQFCFNEGAPMRIFNAAPAGSGLAATDGTKVALMATAAPPAAVEARRLTSLDDAARLEAGREVDLVATVLLAAAHPHSGAPVLFLADPALRLLRLDAPPDALRGSLPWSVAPGETVALCNVRLAAFCPAAGPRPGLAAAAVASVVCADWTSRGWAAANVPPKAAWRHGASVRHLGPALRATRAWAASPTGRAALRLATHAAASLPRARPAPQLPRAPGAAPSPPPGARFAAARVLRLFRGAPGAGGTEAGGAGAERRGAEEDVKEGAGAEEVGAVWAWLEDGRRVVAVRFPALTLLAALRLLAGNPAPALHASDGHGGGNGSTSGGLLHDLVLKVTAATGPEAGAAAEVLTELTHVLGAAPLDFVLGLEPCPDAPHTQRAVVLAVRATE